MWACLQDQDTAGQWKQVAGWRKVCDLALAHLGRLREYRRGLAEAWPPETNAAAQAYVGELDQLIDRVQRTHDAAAANYDALAAAARAIGSARSELQPLYDEFATKLRQKQAYEATIADPKAVAGSRLPERPPVTDDDLEQLNVRARGLMTGLSGELQLAQVMLRQPPPRPVPKVDEIPAGADSPAPMIPPVIPVPLSSAPETKPKTSRTTVGQLSIEPTPGVGPILGGAGNALKPTPPGLALPAAPTTIPGVTPAAGSSPTLPATPIPPTPPLTAKPARNGEPPRRGSGASSSPAPTPPRPTPVGGLIGGLPPGSLGQHLGGGAARRVNPVGGVIGGGAAGTAPTGGAGSRPGVGRVQPGSLPGIHPLGGSPTSANSIPFSNSGRGSKRPEKETGQWDAENPWRTTEGVDPIVQAPEDEGPIDPGPAIGFPR